MFSAEPSCDPRISATIGNNGANKICSGRVEVAYIYLLTSDLSFEVGGLALEVH